MPEGNVDAPKRKARVLRDLALALGLVLGLFALLEGALRLAGIGADTRTSPLAYQEVFPPAMLPARSAAGLEFWRTWDPRHPYQVVPMAKAPDALRVLCFGGSATAGLGFSPNVTFARQLEDLLHESYPSRTIEVLNLGVVAIAAKQVRLLLEEACQSLEPDLLLVWSGNNEFLPVHHQKFTAAHATWRSQLRDRLQSLHLYRSVSRAIHGPPSPADVPDRDPDQDESERLTQARIIQDIELLPAEVQATLEAYQSELAGMVAAAKAAGVAMVLAGVAVNEEWRRREGLAPGWRQEYFGAPTLPADAAVKLQAQLEDPQLSTYERWDRLTRLATAQDESGDVQAAGATWRQALELDPHLRRATAAHLEQARQAVPESGAPNAFFDAPAYLRLDDPRGRVGFRHFYDYVHFSPRGAMLVADGLLLAAQDIEGFPAPEQAIARDDHGLPLVFAQRLERIAAADQDFRASDEFLGIAWDKDRIDSTDLWKYDQALAEIEARLAENPNDVEALLYRGCARALSQQGQESARYDWQRALELDPEAPEAAANLARLAPVPAGAPE